MFRDIRTWVLLYFLVNLAFITTPPIEKAHNWRQTLTNTIARNLAYESKGIMYPVIDHAGERSGIIGAEFPIYNYTIAGMIKAFGFQHWYGRLINLIFTCLGMLAFFGIIKRIHSSKTAFLATLFLLFSVWLTYGRKIMPDTLSVSLVIIGVYFSIMFLDKGKWWQLLLTFLSISLGILIKMPAGLMLAPAGLILFQKKYDIKKRIAVIAAFGTAGILAYLWFFSWVLHLNTYGFMLFFPRTLSEGWAEITEHGWATLNNIVFCSFYSFFGFAVFLASLGFIIYKKQWFPLAILGIATPVFLYFIIKTGITFPYHSYYMVPFAPVMAYIAGYGVSKLPKQNWIIAVVLVFGIESLANQHDDWRIRKADRQFLQLESIADSIDTRDEKIICNGGVGPTLMYFLNRRGWTFETEELQLPLLDSIYTHYQPKYLYIYLTDYEPNGSVYKHLVFKNDFLRVYSPDKNLKREED